MSINASKRKVAFIEEAKDTTEVKKPHEQVDVTNEVKSGLGNAKRQKLNKMQ